MISLTNSQSLELFTDPSFNYANRQFIELSVGPELASYLLKNNHRKNRKLKDKVVAKYARDMKAGRWVFTGESLGIDDEGYLCNGQHRLKAIMQAGIIIKIPFVFGLHKDAMKAMDTGSSRSYSDVLAINHRKHKSSDLATAIRSLAVWEMGPQNFGKNIHASPAFSSSELDQVLMSHPDLEKYVTDPIFANTSVGRNRGIYGFLYYLLSKKYPSESKEFFEGLSTGANLDINSPILVLRNRLDRKQIDSLEVLRTVTKFILISKAWNAFIEGKSISKLVVPKIKRGQAPRVKFIM